MDISLSAAIVTATWGGIVLWANPQRRLNFVAFSMAQHVALWLVCRYFLGRAEDGAVWFRITTAVGAFMPGHLWLFLDSAIHPKSRFSQSLRRGVPWVLSGVFLAGITFTEQFSPWGLAGSEKKNGWGYDLYMGGLGLSYLFLIIAANRAARERQGIEKLELSVILLGGASAGMLTLFLMMAKNHLALRIPQNTQIFIILVFFILLTIVISTHRIFAAKHLLVIGVRSFLVLAIVYLCALQVFGLALNVFDHNVAYMISCMGVLGLYTPLNRMMSRFLKLNPKIQEARKEAFEASRRAIHVSELEREFERVMRAWSQSEKASVTAVLADSSSDTNNIFEEREELLHLVRELKWVTPERLTRERGSARRTALTEFLVERGYGVIVVSESNVAAVLLCIGVRASRRPFTYPEILELQDLGAIAEAAYTRCTLATKAHKAERLATVGVLGASVAHEIRNPLVTIKTFVQLLPDHYGNVAFRDRFFRLMGQEVGRIERLTEQLLDLAAPRKYDIQSHSLHSILKDSMELLSVRAAEKDTQLYSDFKADPDLILTDVNATKQVLLNLCFNAMQAQEKQERVKWVRLETKKHRNGVELCVSDNGPGIAPEMRTRLFETFQTTKSSGFGLGLAVCSEILHSLEATISVDNFVPESGASFRVVFSCPRHSS